MLNKEVSEKLQEQNLEVVSKTKKTKMTKTFIELFIVAFLLGLGTNAIVAGFVALLFPCSGSVCGELQLAGALFVLFGFLLCFMSAIVVLLANIFTE